MGLSLGEPFEMDIPKSLSQAHQGDRRQSHISNFVQEYKMDRLTRVLAWCLSWTNPMCPKTNYLILKFLQDPELVHVALLVHQVKKLQPVRL
jgi:hypothetical protein